MPAMTKVGARLILDGYRAATCDNEKLHEMALEILEHFILSGENPETVTVFGVELVLFMNEVRVEANERQLSGPIRNWDHLTQTICFELDCKANRVPDPLSGPICNWSHTQSRNTEDRASAWAKGGEN